MNSVAKWAIFSILAAFLGFAWFLESETRAQLHTETARRISAEQALDNEVARSALLLGYLQKRTEDLSVCQEMRGSCERRLDSQEEIVNACVAKAADRIGQRRGMWPQ